MPAASENDPICDEKGGKRNGFFTLLSIHFLVTNKNKVIY